MESGLRWCIGRQFGQGLLARLVNINRTQGRDEANRMGKECCNLFLPRYQHDSRRYHKRHRPLRRRKQPLWNGRHRLSIRRALYFSDGFPINYSRNVTCVGKADAHGHGSGGRSVNPLSLRILGQAPNFKKADVAGHELCNVPYFLAYRIPAIRRGSVVLPVGQQCNRSKNCSLPDDYINLPRLALPPGIVSPGQADGIAY